MIAAGSIVKPNAGVTCFVGLVRYWADTVWSPRSVAVTRNCPRLFRLSNTYGIPVCGNVSSSVSMRRRAAAKNHRRSRTIGPTKVPSCSLFTLSSCGVLFNFSNGDRASRARLVSVSRNDPENVLPPRRVTTLMTPPEKRPYSAEMPPVSTCVSSIASSMKSVSGEPNR